MRRRKNVLLSGALLCAVGVSTLQPAFAQNAAVTITVDVPANRRRSIRDLRRGIRDGRAAPGPERAAPSLRRQQHVPLQLAAERRQPGPTGISRASPTSRARPASADDFVAASRDGGAEAMITVPMIEWVAKLGPNRTKLASFYSAKYGPQDDCDWQWFPQACNGMRTAASPSPATTRTTPTCSTSSTLPGAWVQHLVKRVGARAPAADSSTTSSTTSPASGTRRTATCWPTGRDDGAGARHMMVDYAGRDQGGRSRRARRRPGGMGLERLHLQRLRPAVRVAARLELPARPRRARRHGLPAAGCSTQLKQRSDVDGSGCLDIFTVHYYPQGGEFWPTTTSARRCSCAATARRGRSWDPNYSDETWINDRVQLIPRLRELGEHLLLRARRSGSPNTTGAPRATSTARRRRRTSTASSAARGSTWGRGGRRPPRPRRPTRR